MSDVVVNFYDFDILIGQVTIGTLNAGASAPVSFETTFADTGFRLITVKVDPDDLIVELNENNNEASQVLQVGSPDLSTAVMVVEASAISTCQGGATSISGRADYDFSEVPGTQDHPVQGGHVTVTILDPLTNDVLSVFTGSKTQVSGSYNQPILAPTTDDTYPVLVTVTDGTISVEKQTSLTVNNTCPVIPPGSGGGGSDPSNGTPGSDPGVTADVFIYSENIIFSDENPDPGEQMVTFAYINYVGENPVFNMPVALNDIYPVAGVLRSFPIDSTLVSFPNGQDSSPVAISIPWTNTAAGAHIIQAVTEPPFSQFTGNDKATRLIFVGAPPSLQIDKSVSLLVDEDGDGVISPGDTLVYTITYENEGSSDVTGTTITDDYDETLLQSPTQISNGGTVADGIITWNLGTLVAGASGSVTYEVTVIPETEFPSGTTLIVNYALLSTDQAPTVAATHEIEVILNQPPEVFADEPSR